MAKKKTNQQEKKVQVKKKVQKRKKNTRRHVKGEIISWEELENRTGLTGDETELLTVYLHKFERGEVHVRCSKKLKDLAEYIYETESLYIAKHGGFKLLEISSIETKLCNIRQEERERKEEDEKQVKKRVENTNGDDKEVEIVATAEDSMMQTPVIYPVGTVSSSAHKDEAKAFEDFLQTDEAKAILEKAGFTINE